MDNSEDEIVNDEPATFDTISSQTVGALFRDAENPTVPAIDFIQKMADEMADDPDFVPADTVAELVIEETDRVYSETRLPGVDPEDWQGLNCGDIARVLSADNPDREGNRFPYFLMVHHSGRVEIEREERDRDDETRADMESYYMIRDAGSEHLATVCLFGPDSQPRVHAAAAIFAAIERERRGN